ncbi:magnesium/cobalt transporter CorA [Mycolicibacterium confluentis]|uniref:Magnesium transport protein CorA n=1 Tax=Mycolicibacterium confluentis TaxID=28047 RepID=A0A7I7XSX3_9MYCO|nr:magnesium/cobalt transporter CorA [Mycolicibacterium confluentis]MCV7321206.1 magnesium/cobalt transporter CorA [Mycolicibacterium confluentis]ORV25306.1 magnesium transporter [Mycolicibacterium confluentis]BBZ32317.1 magnesium transport protein CorA [Mycolicibacterium confluentis]
MPSFRALPPSLTGANRTPGQGIDAKPIPVPVSRAMVDCAVYVDGTRQPGKYTHAAAVERTRELVAAGQNAFVWIGLHEPDEHQMHSVADIFGLHPLAVEDAVHAHQRPKLERYDNTLFLVLKTVNYVPHESVALAREIVETGEIMVFVGSDFVVTVRHGDHSGLAGVRRRLEDESKHLALGPYGVMHAIADHVVDTYLEVTQLMECDVDAIEEETFSSTAKTDIEQIYMLKREVVELRRAVAPLSVELGRINSEFKDLMTKEVLRYMRDVLDHQTRAADRIASYDEMLTSLVQAALAKVGMQQNVDMRKISAWVAIAAVPTMIAGIYGMNFDHMPELDWTLGYPSVLLFMLLVCATLYRIFRRNHWL